MANVRGELGPIPPEAEIPARRTRVRLRLTDDLPLWLRSGEQALRIAELIVEATYSVAAAAVPFLAPRQYTEHRMGLLRAGSVETAEPVHIRGADFHFGLHYVPVDDDPDHVAALYVTRRPVDNGMAMRDDEPSQFNTSQEPDTAEDA
jgi:hypothetical protein